MKYLSLLTVFIFLITVPNAIALNISYDYTIILNSVENQTNMNVIVPESIKRINCTTDNEPKIIFFAIDRISSEPDDMINFVSVCKNEGNSNDNNICNFKMINGENIYDNCENRNDIDGGISIAGGITVCSGYLKINSGDIYLTPYASNSNSTNSLIFKIPNYSSKKGILVVFNKPTLQKEQNLALVPYYYPLYNGSSGKIDYSFYNWVLTNLRGLKDDFNNSVSRYVINSNSSLAGEGILVYPWVNESNKEVDIGLYNSSGYKITTDSFWNDFDILDDSVWKSTGNNYIINGNLVISPYGGNASIESKEGFSYIRSEWKLKSNLNADKGYEFGFRSCSDDGYFAFLNGEPFCKNCGVPSGNCSKIDLTAEHVYNIEWNKTDVVFYVDGNENCRFDSVNISNLTKCKIFVAAEKNTVVWTVDRVRVSNFLDYSDSNGRINGRTLWIAKETKEGSYILNMSADKENNTGLLIIEPKLNLAYSSEIMENSEIIAGHDTKFSKTLTATSKSLFRPQVLNLNIGNSDITDCIIDSGEVYGDNLIIYNETINKKFSWFENNIESKEIEEKQDLTKQSTIDKQYVVKFVNFVNSNRNRTYSNVKASIYTSGVCENWKESFERISWISEKDRHKFCYIFINELKPLESKVFNITYYGDWIDVNYTDVYQDLNKKNNLEKQYLTKKTYLNFGKKISWENILINTSMPGECENCLQNISFKIPIFWLTFDEANTTEIYDKSGNGNNGILIPNDTNGPKIIEGKIGKAVNFDGIDDYIFIGNKQSLNITNSEMTIIAWIYRLKDNNYDVIVDKSDVSVTEGYRFRISNNKKLTFFVGNGTQHVVESNTPINNNTWYLVAAVVNTTHIKVFVNGLEDASSKFFGNIKTTTVNFQVGHPVSWRSQWFNGTIDDIRIYNKALSEEEIKSLYEGLKDYQDVSFYSYGNWIKYKIEEPIKVEIVNSSQLWIQNIILNNTLNISLINVSVSIPTNPELEPNSLTCSKNDIKLIFNNSYISFLVPKLDRAENFEIKFLTKLSKLTESSNSVTGMFLNDFFITPIAQCIVIIDLIFVIIIISYFVHRRKENENRIV